MNNFTVTLEVPANLRWNEVSDGLNLDKVDPTERPKVRAHFAFLLRQASWKDGIDWNVIANTVTVNVPNDYSDARTIDDTGRYTDGLTCLLIKALEEVDAQTVRRHFVSS